MASLFGKKKKAAPPPTKDPTEVIADISRILETLEKRESHMNLKMEMCVKEAKAKAAKKDKNGALFALKQKKFYENELSKLQGSRMTLFQQRLSLEATATNKLVFEQMQGSLQAMKDARGKIDSDAVEDLVDDMAEEQDMADQIADAISRPAKDMFDDEELNAELAELEELELDEQLMTPSVPSTVNLGTPAAAMPSVPTSVFMPSVPTSAISAPAAAEETEEERQLRELTASMA